MLSELKTHARDSARRLEAVQLDSARARERDTAVIRELEKMCSSLSEIRESLARMIEHLSAGK